MVPLLRLLGLVLTAHAWLEPPDLPGWYFSLRHAYVVDSYANNLLMRIGNPSVYDFWSRPTVSTGALEQELRRAAGSLFPEGPVDLVDVTLLTTEHQVLAAEGETFGSSLVRWPMVGIPPYVFKQACQERGIKCPSSLQPDELAPHSKRQLAADFSQWAPDELDSRVVALRGLLEGKLDTGLNVSRKNDTKKARVVFFHCLCGCDRTGQLFAAYAMRYKNMTLTEALAENELVAGRHMYYAFQAAAQWYCENLRVRGLYAHGDCGNCKPYRCHDTGAPFDPNFVKLLVCLGIATAMTLLVLLVLGMIWRYYADPDDDGYYYYRGSE